MTENIEHEISMKQYLLGELTESEQQELEERLMTSNECFGELLIAEDKLVDEYLGRRLSAREKEKFNDYFLCTPERRHKLRFSRSLRNYVLANGEKPRIATSRLSLFDFLRAPYPAVGQALAAALLLVVLGGSWLTVRMKHLEHLLDQVQSRQMVPPGQQQDLQQQSAQLRERNDQLAGELQLQKEQRTELEQELGALKTSPIQHSSSSMVAFALTHGVVRGDTGGMKKVTIPAGANWVQLQLDLGTGDYQRYQAVLQKAEGEEISSQITPRIKTGDDTEAGVFTLPAKLLPHGDYSLKLSGIPASGDPEDIGSYSFRVLQ
jgi:hypothetical protein